MPSDIQRQMHELEELRLPELQARFAEIVGERTRTPNKQYLLRRIAEALEAKQVNDGGGDADDVSEHMAGEDVTTEVDDAKPATTADLGDIKLTKLTIPELRERYRQTVQRETRSTSAAYLQWKIRQAEKGRVRIGPIQRQTSEGEFKVLPLRMAAETVTALDEARVRLGLKSRMELIRQALQAYLDQAGELEVAALFGESTSARGEWSARSHPHVPALTSSGFALVTHRIAHVCRVAAMRADGGYPAGQDPRSRRRRRRLRHQALQPRGAHRSDPRHLQSWDPTAQTGPLSGLSAQGDGSFRLDAYHAGITTENAWGIGAADFDHDGDLDVFSLELFENTHPNPGHFLQLRVVGTTANRFGIGATVAVTAGGTTRIRHVQGGTGKGGQDSLYLHYGLGDVTTIDAIEVTFPGGATATYTGPFHADQRLWLYQDQTAPVASWGRPN